MSTLNNDWFERESAKMDSDFEAASKTVATEFAKRAAANKAAFAAAAARVDATYAQDVVRMQREHKARVAAMVERPAVHLGGGCSLPVGAPSPMDDPISHANNIMHGIG